MAAAAAVDDEKRRRRQEKLGRPRMPKLTGLGTDHTTSFNTAPASSSALLSPPSQLRHSSPSPSSHNNTINNVNERLVRLNIQFKIVLELSNSVQAQHMKVQSMIAMLEEMVYTSSSLLSFLSPLTILLYHPNTSSSPINNHHNHHLG